VTELEHVLTKLEAALMEGDLTSVVKDLTAFEPGTEAIIEHYRSLAASNSVTPSRFRRDGFSSVHALFKQAIRPSEKWFPASVVHPEPFNRPQPDLDSTGTPCTYRAPIRLISVEMPLSSVLLRIDQVVASRGWGIGFIFADLETDQFIESTITKKALSDLIARLRSLQQMEYSRYIDKDTGAPNIFSKSGLLFENLMIDILNEDKFTTSRAPLNEDLWEKTDLRIHLQGLNRTRGARIQVTRTTDPIRYNEKLLRIKRLGELVILSPVSLGEALIQDEVFGTGSQGLLPTKDLCQLWSYFKGPPKTVSECANKIKVTLLEALKNQTGHPLGPMSSVPPPLRALIRNYVMNQAFQTTGLLRQREARSKNLVRD
jgi:hypothetical protein